jgi:GntR family trehalose operon transcriptional repressor
MQKKYLTIYDDLVKKIQTNVWTESTLLPSENELAVMYETSRETIRKALNVLSQKGYIHKIRGKGSVVIDTHKFNFPVSEISSFNELAESLQLESHTIVVTLGLVAKDHDVRKKLLVTGQGQVWQVDRIREIDGEKVILDKDYFNEGYVPMPSKEVCQHSIYHYIEHELGLSIGFAKKEIIVEEPTEEDRALLDLEGFSNVVIIKSLVYLADTTLFQYTESRHRPDKFRFVDFARRGSG